MKIIDQKILCDVIIQMQLPVLLVQDLIDWYYWRCKVKKLNENFSNQLILYERYFCYKPFNYNDNTPEFIIIRLLGKNRMIFSDMCKTIGSIHRKTRIILLPRRYYYSSGLRDPAGYKDCEEWVKLENWNNGKKEGKIDHNFQVIK